MNRKLASTFIRAASGLVLLASCLSVQVLASKNVPAVDYTFQADGTVVDPFGQQFRLVPLNEGSTSNTTHEGGAEGGEGECEELVHDGGTIFLYSMVCLFLVCMAGMMSGLTVGLMAIDPLKLELLQRTGSEVDRMRVRRLAPILKKHHLLLVTLLLVNAVCMEALPIFLDRLVPSVVAILISVTAVLIFGEILPQAFCTSDPLRIGSTFAPLIRVIMSVCWIVAAPIAWLLDRLLGHDNGHHIVFNRSELCALIDMQPTLEAELQNFTDDAIENSGSDEQKHGLVPDEVSILKGALSMRSKTVRDVLTPLDKVQMLDETRLMNHDAMADLLAHGHSRIPVYKDFRNNIQGFLLTKRLIAVNPADARPARDFVHRDPIVVHPDTPLLQVLNTFQRGTSHLALVSPEVHLVQYAMRHRDRDIPPSVKILGIVTIEDIFEELIQEEIIDETDYVVGSPQNWSDQQQNGVAGQYDTPAVRRAVAKFKDLLAQRRLRQTWQVARAQERRHSVAMRRKPSIPPHPAHPPSDVTEREICRRVDEAMETLTRGESEDERLLMESDYDDEPRRIDIEMK
ncbi:MAG: hypothetical protein MHM6MM_006492 [Cercozoa sp. M6MM]